MAFKTAARIGFRRLLTRQNLFSWSLWPSTEITVPDSYAVPRRFRFSRSCVEGMSSGTGVSAGETTIKATIPYAEVTGYATRLRSLSRGTGEYTVELADTSRSRTTSVLVLLPSTPSACAAGER